MLEGRFDTVNFDASYEYFSLDDKYSVDWQENMDALWARSMKEEDFQPKYKN